jgi:hypothetical protein
LVIGGAINKGGNMFKSIAKFLINKLSVPVVLDLIKAQIPKLSDEQKQEVLEITKELISAAAQGAVAGAVNGLKK